LPYNEKTRARNGRGFFCAFFLVFFYVVVGAQV